MITARLRHVSDRAYVPGIVRRAEAPTQAMRAAVAWIIGTRIPAMYRDRGTVRGAQGRWAKLSVWTIAGKGHDRPLVRTGAMMRGYRISIRRLGLRAYTLAMTNLMSGADVDYPAILHFGAKSKVRRPKKPGGVLGPIALPGGDIGFFKRTKPKATPARPHLNFLEPDSRRLLQEVAQYVMRPGPMRGGGSTLVIAPVAPR